MKPRPLRFSRARRGYSLIEVLFTLGALSSVAAVGLTVVRQTVSPATETRLEADVRQINNAIVTYKVNGGDLTGITDAQAVVDKLKTVVKDDGTDKQALALKNSMVDPRVKVVRTPGGKTTQKTVARYNTASQKFELTQTADDSTVQGFVLGTAAASETGETRRTVLAGSKGSGWVWGYGESSKTRDTMKTATTGSATPTTPGASADTETAQALPPILNPLPPQTALTSYPLTVNITNPNPAGSSQLYYSLNGAAYTPYTTSLSTEPGTTIRAVAVSLDPDHMSDSPATQQSYVPTPVTLSLTDTAPSAVSYFQVGGAAATGSPAVTALAASTISLANAASIPSRYISSNYFQVTWSFAGTAANSAAFSNGYPGQSFNITKSSFGTSNAVALSYRAVSLDPIFTSSTQVTKSVGISPLALNAPKLANSSQTLTMAADFSTAVPSGYRLYYSFTGDPGDNQGEPVSGTLYQSAVTAPSSGGTLYARVYPPTDSKAWFTTSTLATLAIPSQNTNYMGDYNVIVFTDLYTTTAIEGKTWVGGNLTNGNAFSLGRNYSPTAAENVIVVGGSLGSGNAFTMEGNSYARLAMTSTSNRGSRSINWNGGGNEASRLVYDSAIPSKTATMQQQLQALSASLNTATATSTVVTPTNQTNKRVLTCTPNAKGVAVFNIAASSLFGASNLAEVSLDFATGVTEASVKGVLINVSGSSVVTGNQFNFTGKFTDDTWRKKILWNVPAATTMNMAAQRMDGAVLAPYAAVTSNNDFKGSLVCKSLNLQGSCFRLPFGSTEILSMGQ